MPYLLVIQGADSGTQFAIAESELELGRAPTCDIVLRDSTVSRHHARIKRVRNKLHLEDLNSHHGTMVNGRKLRRRHVLREYDEIQVGECVLTFYAADPAPRPTDTGKPDSGSRVLDARDSSNDDLFAVARLRALMDLIQTVGVSLDLNESMSRIHSSLMRVLPNARGGCVSVKDEEGRLSMMVSRDRDGSDREGPNVSQTIVNQVMQESKAVLIDDAWKDSKFQTESVFQLDLRSIMCAPLLVGDQALGMIHVEAREVERPFTSKDLRVLINIANLAGKVVAHARLHESQIEFERRQQDLQLARQLQLHFLPPEPPALSGYQLAHMYRAADAIGGDYFNYIPLPDGRLAVVIADVAGKGVAAALLMARLCSDVRYSLVANAHPAAAMNWLNQQMCVLNDYDRFVTLAVCVLDPQSHVVELVNAGHLPPWLCAGEGPPQQLGADTAGPPLGVSDDWDYEALRHPLAPSDSLILYTDGVSDTVNPAGEFFTNRRVAEVLERPRTAIDYVAALRQAVEEFSQGARQRDDLCVVAATRTE